MDRCANTEALHRYLSGEEMAELAQEAFYNDADEILAEIQELAEQLKHLADGYDHGNQTYDFTEEVSDLIKEVI